LLQRLPRVDDLGAPETRPDRRATVEARRLNQRLHHLGDLLSVRALEARRKTDVVQQAVIVVETQQQRADNLGPFAVAKAADDAIGRPSPLDLLHAVALARAIRQIEPLGD